MLSDMWLEWKALSTKRKLNEIAADFRVQDPWGDNVSPCKVKPIEIDEQFLKFVAPMK
ncbi:putative protein family PM-7 [Prochlorococcus marinus str. SS51]|nr:putative protein family PM-7 [Prochlorococcus marinus str. LG]KGG24227.1 putative protein family PM-7 [Prochlorococcus marinus str. SS35]KGG33160.1 putative protein family PM-7 [Prochlorococcus marinus str. SS51]